MKTTLTSAVCGLAMACAAWGSADATSAGDQSWSGLYVGGTVGWVGKEYDWSFNPGIPGAPHQAYSLNQDEGIVGGLVGAQVQWGQVVLGAEASYGSSGVFGRDWARERNFGINTIVDSVVRMGPLFTFGPRLGWAVDSNWLLFASAGYAAANVQSAGQHRVRGHLLRESGISHDGWFAGFGLEYAITPSLILGAEYQRIDLGAELHCGPTCPLGGPNNHDIDPAADVVRARLSVKLGVPRVDGD